MWCLSALTVALALAVVPAAASAALPEWSKPEPLASATGGGDVGIDGSGAITAIWSGGGARGTFVATRPAGARRFQPVETLDPGRSHKPRLGVGDSGGAVALWSRDDSASCDQLACRSTLRISLRRPGGRFRTSQELPASSGISYSDAVVAGDEAIVAWDTRGGGLRVARGSLTRGLGTPQLLATGSETYDAPFSLAANERGDAVIAWTAGDPTTGGLAVMASFRPAGGRFAAPEKVFQREPATSYDSSADAAVDGRGRAVLALSSGGDRMSVARRSADGGWRLATVGTGFGGQVVADADGDLMAWWSRAVAQEQAFPRYESDVALAAPGRPFGASRSLPVGSGTPVLGGFDSRSNAVFVSAGPQPGQRLVAGTIDRFGNAAVSELNGEPSQPLELAVNGSGAAVALSIVFRAGKADLVVVDRKADESQPRVTMSSARVTPTVFEARMRCDEPCRVRVAGRAAPARSAARLPARRAQILREGRQLRVRLAIPARERRRLRRALRGRSTVRVRLALRVEDAAGNRRIVRRVATVRR